MTNNVKRTSFEVQPLDVNIVTIQFNLLKRLKVKVPSDGESISEQYNSKNPVSDLGDLVVTFRCVENQAILDVLCTNKVTKEEFKLELSKGGIQEVIKYLDTTVFFEDVKAFAKKIDE